MGNQESYPHPSTADGLRHFLIQTLYLLKPHNEWSQDDKDRLIQMLPTLDFGPIVDGDQEWCHNKLNDRCVTATMDEEFLYQYKFVYVDRDRFVVIHVNEDGDMNLHGIYTWDEVVSFILNEMPPFNDIVIRSGYDPSTINAGETRIYACRENGSVYPQRLIYNDDQKIPTRNCMIQKDESKLILPTIQALARKKIAQRRNRNVIKGISRDISYRPPSGVFPGGEGYRKTQDEFDRARSQQRDLLDDEEKE